MPDSTDINTGAVGSIVMILLTIAFVLLLVSFYRRYKRASQGGKEVTSGQVQDSISETPHEKK